MDNREVRDRIAELMGYKRITADGWLIAPETIGAHPIENTLDAAADAMAV